MIFVTKIEFEHKSFVQDIFCRTGRHLQFETFPRGEDAIYRYKLEVEEQVQCTWCMERVGWHRSIFKAISHMASA